MKRAARARLEHLFERVDSLTLRERAIGFVVALAALVYAWHLLIYAPLDARRGALEARVERLRAEFGALQEQTDTLARARSVDPDAGARERLAVLRAEAGAIRAALAGVLEHLVPPGEMAEVLEAVLTRETGLRLVSLESLGADPVASTAAPAGISAASTLAPPEPVRGDPDAVGVVAGALAGIADGPTGAGGEPPLTLYRHGLRVRFTGGYLDALAYLRALEALSWRFMWDSVALAVTEHPSTEVTITVYSMSLDEQWIGV